MANYPVIHKETGETKVVECSVHEIMEWYKENPDWERDWSHGAATVASEVGEWREKLANKHSDWNEVLGKASKINGSRVRKL